MKRKKIGVYIDYILREPNIEGSLFSFLEMIKKITSEEETEDVIYNENHYWRTELLNKEVYGFYMKLYMNFYSDKVKNINLYNLDKLFYNKEHYNKFLRDASYVLFSTADKKIPEVFDYLGLISQVFDIVLLDYIVEGKQNKHTLGFLNKYYVPFTELRLVSKKKKKLPGIFYTFENFKDSESVTKESILNKLKELEKEVNG